MTIWFAGQLLPDAARPGFANGLRAPFETMAAVAADLPLWSRHLARLQATCHVLGIDWAPSANLRAAASDLLLRNGHGEHVLRLSVVPNASQWQALLETRARGVHGTVMLVPVVTQRRAGPCDQKCWPRQFFDAARQQAQDAGADDGILLDANGEVLETTTSNLWLRHQGVWRTPNCDGRLLPGIARALLLERAAARQVPCVAAPCTLGELHAAEAIAVSNAVHGPRPARLLGDARPVAEFVQRELQPLWPLLLR